VDAKFPNGYITLKLGPLNICSITSVVVNFVIIDTHWPLPRNYYQSLFFFLFCGEGISAPDIFFIVNETIKKRHIE
jgi:hypothetical protein